MFCRLEELSLLLIGAVIILRLRWAHCLVPLGSVWLFATFWVNSSCIRMARDSDIVCTVWLFLYLSVALVYLCLPFIFARPLGPVALLLSSHLFKPTFFFFKLKFAVLLWGHFGFSDCQPTFVVQICRGIGNGSKIGLSCLTLPAWRTDVPRRIMLTKLTSFPCWSFSGQCYAQESRSLSSSGLQLVSPESFLKGLEWETIKFGDTVPMFTASCAAVAQPLASHVKAFVYIFLFFPSGWSVIDMRNYFCRTSQTSKIVELFPQLIVWKKSCSAPGNIRVLVTCLLW